MSESDFKISEAATARITKMLEGEPEGSFFRVSVNGGGCSGFMYEFKIDTTKEESDISISDSIVVDDLSITFLNESTLDFHEDLGSSHFLVKNPNATAKCGCGNSFAI